MLEHTKSESNSTQFTKLKDTINVISDSGKVTVKKKRHKHRLRDKEFDTVDTEEMFQGAMSEHTQSESNTKQFTKLKDPVNVISDSGKATVKKKKHKHRLRDKEFGTVDTEEMFQGAMSEHTQSESNSKGFTKLKDCTVSCRLCVAKVKKKKKRKQRFRDEDRDLDRVDAKETIHYVNTTTIDMGHTKPNVKINTLLNSDNQEFLCTKSNSGNQKEVGENIVCTVTLKNKQFPPGKMSDDNSRGDSEKTSCRGELRPGVKASSKSGVHTQRSCIKSTHENKEIGESIVCKVRSKCKQSGPGEMSDRNNHGYQVKCSCHGELGPGVKAGNKGDRQTQDSDVKLTQEKGETGDSVLCKMKSKTKGLRPGKVSASNVREHQEKPSCVEVLRPDVKANSKSAVHSTMHTHGTGVKVTQGINELNKKPKSQIQSDLGLSEVEVTSDKCPQQLDQISIDVSDCSSDQCDIIIPQHMWKCHWDAYDAKNKINNNNNEPSRLEPDFKSGIISETSPVCNIVHIFPNGRKYVCSEWDSVPFSYGGLVSKPKCEAADQNLAMETEFEKRILEEMSHSLESRLSYSPSCKGDFEPCQTTEDQLSTFCEDSGSEGCVSMSEDNETCDKNSMTSMREILHSLRGLTGDTPVTGPTDRKANQPQEEQADLPLKEKSPVDAEENRSNRDINGSCQVDSESTEAGRELLINERLNDRTQLSDKSTYCTCSESEEEAEDGGNVCHKMREMLYSLQGLRGKEDVQMATGSTVVCQEKRLATETQPSEGLQEEDLNEDTGESVPSESQKNQTLTSGFLSPDHVVDSLESSLFETSDQLNETSKSFKLMETSPINLSGQDFKISDEKLASIFKTSVHVHDESKRTKQMETSHMNLGDQESGPEIVFEIADEQLSSPDFILDSLENSIFKTSSQVHAESKSTKQMETRSINQRNQDQDNKQDCGTCDKTRKVQVSKITGKKLSPITESLENSIFKTAGQVNEESKGMKDVKIKSLNLSNSRDRNNRQASFNNRREVCENADQQLSPFTESLENSIFKTSGQVNEESTKNIEKKQIQQSIPNRNKRQVGGSCVKTGADVFEIADKQLSPITESLENSIFKTSGQVNEESTRHIEKTHLTRNNRQASVKTGAGVFEIADKQLSPITESLENSIFKTSLDTSTPFGGVMKTRPGISGMSEKHTGEHRFMGEKPSLFSGGMYKGSRVDKQCDMVLESVDKFSGFIFKVGRTSERNILDFISDTDSSSSEDELSSSVGCCRSNTVISDSIHSSEDDGEVISGKKGINRDKEGNNAFTRHVSTGDVLSEDKIGMSEMHTGEHRLMGEEPSLFSSNMYKDSRVDKKCDIVLESVDKFSGFSSNIGRSSKRNILDFISDTDSSSSEDESSSSVGCCRSNTVISDSIHSSEDDMLSEDKIVLGKQNGGVAENQNVNLEEHSINISSQDSDENDSDGKQPQTLASKGFSCERSMGALKRPYTGVLNDGKELQQRLRLVDAPTDTDAPTGCVIRRYKHCNEKAKSIALSVEIIAKNGHRVCRLLEKPAKEVDKEGTTLVPAVDISNMDEKRLNQEEINQLKITKPSLLFKKCSVSSSESVEAVKRESRSINGIAENETNKCNVTNVSIEGQDLGQEGSIETSGMNKDDTSGSKIQDKNSELGAVDNGRSVLKKVQFSNGVNLLSVIKPFEKVRSDNVARLSVKRKVFRKVFKKVRFDNKASSLDNREVTKSSNTTVDELEENGGTCSAKRLCNLEYINRFREGKSPVKLEVQSKKVKGTPGITENQVDSTENPVDSSTQNESKNKPIQVSQIVSAGPHKKVCLICGLGCRANIVQCGYCAKRIHVRCKKSHFDEFHPCIPPSSLWPVYCNKAGLRWGTNKGMLVKQIIAPNPTEPNVNLLLASQNQTTSYKCCRCDFDFELSETVVDHIKQEHDVDAVNCTRCGMVLYAHQEMLVSRHRYFCQDGALHQCSFCHRVFGSEKTAALHRRGIHKTDYTAEPWSNKRGQVRLRQHESDMDCRKNQIKRKTAEQDGLKSVAIPPGFKLKCAESDCAFSTTILRQLKDHNKFTHGYTKDEVNQICQVCFKVFRKRSQRERHEVVEHLDRDLFCDICGNSFYIRTQYTSHKLYHHQGKRAEMCEKQKLKRALTGAKECEQCGKQYKSPYLLKQHVRIYHEKSLAITCHVCGKLFLAKHRLLTHLNRHGGIKPYKCTVCPYKGYSGAQVNKHMRKLHPGVEIAYKKTTVTHQQGI